MAANPYTDYSYLFDSSQYESRLHTLRIDWSVCCALMSIAAAVMVPVYTRFVREWDRHHPIVQASVTLVLPDLLLVINFLPLEAMNLAVDHFASRNYCIFSAFATVAGIVASNAGVIYISYTTYSVIVLGQRKTNYRSLIGVQVLGWAIGMALAGYYYSQDYLGIYLGLYCCTKTKHELDIVIPVFLCFAIASSTMGVFYYKTFAHIREVEEKAQDLKGRPQQGAAALTAAPAPPIRAGQPPSQVAMVALPPARGTNGTAATTPQRSLPPSAPASRDHSRLGPAAQALPGAAATAGARDESVVVQIGAGGEESKLGGGGGTATRAWGSTPAPGTTAPSAALDATPQQQDQVVTVTVGPAAAAGVTAPAAPAGATSTPSTSNIASSGDARRAAMAERKSKSLALSMLKRGLGLIGVYYFCWFFVSLNGALALADVHYTSLWPEMIAAWLIKLSPLIDALILGDLMRRAAANKAGAARAVGGVAQTRIEDSANTGSSVQSSAAEPMVVRRVVQKGSPAPAGRNIAPGAAGAGGPGAAAANKRASGSYNVANPGAVASGIPLSGRVRNPSSSQIGMQTGLQGGSALASPVHLGRRVTPGTGGSGSGSVTPTHARGASTDLAQGEQDPTAAAARPVLPVRGTIGGNSVDGGWVFPGLTAISDAPSAATGSSNHNHSNSIHAQLSPSHAQAQGLGPAPSAQSHSRGPSQGGVASTTLVTPLLPASLSGSSSPGPAGQSDNDTVVLHVRVPGLAPSPVAEDPAAEEAQQSPSPWPAVAR